MNAREKQQLELDGYAVIEDVLDPQHDIQPLFEEYEAVLDDLVVDLRRDGAITSEFRHLPFAARLIAVAEEAGRSFGPYFDISLPQSGITAQTPIHLGPAVFRILTNATLLDLVEDVLGGEILVSPIQHVRMKLPLAIVANAATDGLSASVPWHQDNGVMLEEADHTNVLTVWLPLNDATLENGCLRVIPGSHREGLQEHCPSPVKGPHIPARRVQDRRAVSLPMKAGSTLLMHRRTVHSSLDNQTDAQVRFSLDLRYQPVGQPTGRPQFPSFVARCRSQPEAELHEPKAWANMWLDAREQLPSRERLVFNRWHGDSPACA